MDEKCPAHKMQSATSAHVYVFADPSLLGLASGLQRCAAFPLNGSKLLNDCSKPITPEPSKSAGLPHGGPATPSMDAHPPTSSHTTSPGTTGTPASGTICSTTKQAQQTASSSPTPSTATLGLSLSQYALNCGGTRDQQPSTSSTHPPSGPRLDHSHPFQMSLISPTPQLKHRVSSACSEALHQVLETNHSINATLASRITSAPSTAGALPTHSSKATGPRHMFGPVASIVPQTTHPSLSPGHAFPHSQPAEGDLPQQQAPPSSLSHTALPRGTAIQEAVDAIRKQQCTPLQQQLAGHAPNQAGFKQRGASASASRSMLAAEQHFPLCLADLSRLQPHGTLQSRLRGISVLPHAMTSQQQQNAQHLAAAARQKQSELSRQHHQAHQQQQQERQLHIQQHIKQHLQRQQQQHMDHPAHASMPVIKQEPSSSTQKGKGKPKPEAKPSKALSSKPKPWRTIAAPAEVSNLAGSNVGNDMQEAAGHSSSSYGSSSALPAVNTDICTTFNLGLAFHHSCVFSSITGLEGPQVLERMGLALVGRWLRRVSEGGTRSQVVMVMDFDTHTGRYKVKPQSAYEDALNKGAEWADLGTDSGGSYWFLATSTDLEEDRSASLDNSGSSQSSHPLHQLQLLSSQQLVPVDSMPCQELPGKKRRVSEGFQPGSAIPVTMMSHPKVQEVLFRVSKQVSPAVEVLGVPQGGSSVRSGDPSITQVLVNPWDVIAGALQCGSITSKQLHIMLHELHNVTAPIAYTLPRHIQESSRKRPLVASEAFAATHPNGSKLPYNQGHIYALDNLPPYNSPACTAPVRESTLPLQPSSCRNPTQLSSGMATHSPFQTAHTLNPVSLAPIALPPTQHRSTCGMPQHTSAFALPTPSSRTTGPDSGTLHLDTPTQTAPTRRFSMSSPRTDSSFNLKLQQSVHLADPGFPAGTLHPAPSMLEKSALNSCVQPLPTLWPSLHRSDFSPGSFQHRATNPNDVISPRFHASLGVLSHSQSQVGLSSSTQCMPQNTTHPSIKRAFAMPPSHDCFNPHPGTTRAERERGHPLDNAPLSPDHFISLPASLPAFTSISDGDPLAMGPTSSQLSSLGTGPNQSCTTPQLAAPTSTATSTQDASAQHQALMSPSLASSPQFRNMPPFSSPQMCTPTGPPHMLPNFNFTASLECSQPHSSTMTPLPKHHLQSDLIPNPLDSLPCIEAALNGFATMTSPSLLSSLHAQMTSPFSSMLSPSPPLPISDYQVRTQFSQQANSIPDKQQPAPSHPTNPVFPSSIFNLSPCHPSDGSIKRELSHIALQQDLSESNDAKSKQQQGNAGLGAANLDGEGSAAAFLHEMLQEGCTMGPDSPAGPNLLDIGLGDDIFGTSPHHASCIDQLLDAMDATLQQLDV